MKLVWVRQVVLLVSVVLAASILGLTVAVWDGARTTLSNLTDVVGRYTWTVVQRDIPGVQPAGLPVSSVSVLQKQTGAKRVGLATGQTKALGGFGYTYQGVNADFFAVRRLRVQQGRIFAGRSEVVVGTKLKDRLGKRIQVGFGEYRVVGVLEPLAGRDETDATLDGTAFVPLEGYAGVDPEVRWLYLETPPERFAATRATLETWLGALNRNYRVEALSEQYGLRLRERVSRLLGGALSIAAVCTLLVASLNLYAFFVARALERVQALGVRRAVGASRAQLLWEELVFTFPWMLGGVGLSLPLVFLLCSSVRWAYNIPAEVGPATWMTMVGGVALMVSLATVVANRPYLLRPPVEALRGGMRRSVGGSFWLSAAGLVLGLSCLVLQASVGNSVVLESERLTGQMGPRTALYNPRLLTRASFSDPRGQVELRRSSYLRLKQSGVAPLLEHTAFVMSPFDTLTGPRDTRFTSVRLVEGDYAQITPVPFLAGRWPQVGRSEVALGNRLAQNLFGSLEESVGKSLQVLGKTRRIVGVFQGASPLGAGAKEDQAMMLAGDVSVSESGVLWVQVRPNLPFTPTLEKVTRFLNDRYGRPDLLPIFALTAGDFSSDLVRALEQLRQVYGVLSLALLLLGALGLGLQRFGAGLARVNEVGVRRAVGGLPRHIFGQFLGEAAQLSLWAGLLGIVLGIGMSFGVARAQGILWTVDGFSVVAALAASLLVGVLAAWFPARWASQRPPLEALRERP